MIGKTGAIAGTDAALDMFPEFPPREDMQNLTHLYQQSVISALIHHLGSPETTIVYSEVPVTPTLDPWGDFRIPDLMVAFQCDPTLAYAQKGYAIDRQGKPPDFVLEVASPTTGVEDYTNKRRDYERFGIPEYWRFDASGGEYHDLALAGDMLVDGEYRPVQVEWQGDAYCRGYSRALGLYLCWDAGQLRFYDPNMGTHLRTHLEDIARANQESARAEQESTARRKAEDEVRRLRDRLASLEDM